MTLVALTTYCLALLLAVATPGPAMFAVVTTGVSRGTFSALAVGLGIALSDVALVSIALAGLVAIAQSYSWLFAVIKYAGASYLVFLGYRMWRAGSRYDAGMIVQRVSAARQFGMGAMIAFGNPKAILFHASLMPLILNVDAFERVRRRDHPVGCFRRQQRCDGHLCGSCRSVLAMVPFSHCNPCIESNGWRRHDWNRGLHCGASITLQLWRQFRSSLSWLTEPRPAVRADADS